MISVRLFTTDGVFVTEVLCPPFQSMPDVLVWGNRTFGRNATGQYREVSACCVFTRAELDLAEEIGAVT